MYTLKLVMFANRKPILAGNLHYWNGQQFGAIQCGILGDSNINFWDFAHGKTLQIDTFIRFFDVIGAKGHSKFDVKIVEKPRIKVQLSMFDLTHSDFWLLSSGSWNSEQQHQDRSFPNVSQKHKDTNQIKMKISISCSISGILPISSMSISTF